MNQRKHGVSALLLIVAATLIAGGCATKRYGRMQTVSGVEERGYTCEDIEIELAKVAEFRKQIAEGSEVNIASIGGFLGDFGIGNAMEKNAAEKTAAMRETELLALKANKGC